MKGGKQPGAGRPKGSVTRPQIRDYFTQEDIRNLVDDAVRFLKQGLELNPNSKNGKEFALTIGVPFK